MDVLFAPLRSKQLNPEAWTNKIKFWTDLIEKWCKHNKKCSVNLEELKNAFERAGKSPYCLTEVLQEAVQSGDLVEHNRHLANLRQAQASWGGWVKGLGVQALQSVGGRLFGGSIEKAKLIVPSAAEVLAKDLLSMLRSSQEILSFNDHKLFNENEMKAALGEFENDEASYCLDCLIAQQRVVKAEGVFKVCLTKDKAAAVDDVDKGVLQISATLEALDKDVAKIEKDIEAARSKAKDYLKKGLRDSAKGHLKRSKRFENSLQTKLNQKNNIESVLEEVLNASSNEDVVLAYRAGLSALRASLGDKDVDEVKELTSDIGQLLERNTQIGEVLSESADLGQSELADLELELDALVRDMDSRTKSDEETELMKQLEKLEVVEDQVESKQKLYDKVEEGKNVSRC